MPTDIEIELFAQLRQKELRIYELEALVEKLSGTIIWDKAKISCWMNREKGKRKPQARITFTQNKEFVTQMGCTLHKDIESFDKAYLYYIENEACADEREMLSEFRNGFLECFKHKDPIFAGLLCTVNGSNLGTHRPFWALMFLEPQKFLMYTPRHKNGINHKSDAYMAKEKSDHVNNADYIAYIYTGGEP
jgi:hypothetical protein